MTPPRGFSRLSSVWLHTLIAMLCLLAVPATHASGQRAATSEAGFPHTKHDKLFPQCSGCHLGIATGNRATSFPDTTLCGQCHNNRDQKKVAWMAPTRTPSNLRFSHPDHQRQTGSAGATCTSCHATPDAPWMHVDRAAQAQCQSCHTHRAASHYALDNRCATCHVPLTQATGLTVARVGAFSKPPSHAARDFAQKHSAAGADAQAQCMTCHARESCARCHVNASKVTAQYQLAADVRVAGLLAGKPASYVRPASHASTAFLESHGALARSNVATCTNCHARASCQSCHTGNGGAAVIADVPTAEPGSAAGVLIKPSAKPWNGLTESSVLAGRIALGPASTQQVTGVEPRKAQVHAPGFARTHGAAAASGQLTCEGCHSRSYCAECHAGEGKRRFHVANFAARHAPEAWGRDTDCQQCHNPEVFCRGCHLQVGLSSAGRSNVGYHSAVPLWTLQHGQAARQGLQSCTSCHTQKDCMQCHSQSGRNISPHGPGFDARRMWKANRLICLRCHFKDPLDTR